MINFLVWNFVVIVFLLDQLFDDPLMCKLKLPLSAWGIVDNTTNFPENGLLGRVKEYGSGNGEMKLRRTISFDGRAVSITVAIDESVGSEEANEHRLRIVLQSTKTISFSGKLTLRGLSLASREVVVRCAVHNSCSFWNGFMTSSRLSRPSIASDV